MFRLSFFILVLLFGSLSSYAIKPSYSYSNTPAKMELKYEELKLNTSDGALLNVWHLPADTGICKTPIVLTLSDAGNMGDWLYLGAYLQAYGCDIWMFDYRGFGSSSIFEMEQEQLFYPEFVFDLATVCDYVYEQTRVVPALLGFSMGTLIINEYIKDFSLPIQLLIFDGYVNNPQEWVNRINQTGKNVKLPEGYCYFENKYNQDCLFIVEQKDRFFSMADIPQPESENTQIEYFDCEHISAFFTSPKKYVELIQQFVLTHER